MGKKVTIGGNRLGSGNQMKTELHNYGRSTHNLSNNFISSMAPGVLVPFYCKPALNGDTFDIDLASMVRTIPTQAPLFGSFKLQLDMFQCPIRLYHGLLHNNALNIGMKMADVKLPMLGLQDYSENYQGLGKGGEMNKSSLMRYLGLSGIGVGALQPQESATLVRGIQAIPVLCYYDIFKNYFANRQETNAFCITGNIHNDITDVTDWHYNQFGTGKPTQQFYGGKAYEEVDLTKLPKSVNIQIYGQALNITNVMCSIWDNSDKDWVDYQLYQIINGTANDYLKYIQHTVTNDNSELSIAFEIVNEYATRIKFYEAEDTTMLSSSIKLQSFPLENIDNMRNDILKDSELGTHFWISNSDHHYLPYSTLTDMHTSGLFAYNRCVMNGLCVKTYQSDLFNAWVQTEWIDGVNGIAAVTAVSTAGNQLKLDALNLAQKVYNMLNRIAVSGGTYEDWQEAVYSQNAIRHAETPIYLGGMSSEIVFEEIVSTAAATSDGESAPLGSLAGKGKLLGNKGGKLYFKVHEPSYILGIVSITPRVCYTQGNSWDLTDLQTMDDLHKPALDGIGFQDLMTEQAAWWDAIITDDWGDALEPTRTAFGKVPAWINYMTDYDKAFGDFAEENGKGFMVLSRNYERTNIDLVNDLTTYIDPTKFNYAFAYNELAAQNFWVQIAMNIKARRIMSAKIIPTL